ncbi:hypothetical protein B0H19DRAFT_1058894 [Mycena capillaripes]|nr:hypothetical protein B0H19DRAFT_1058894 [Mycena capillaripes]
MTGSGHIYIQFIDPSRFHSTSLRLAHRSTRVRLRAVDAACKATRFHDGRWRGERGRGARRALVAVQAPCAQLGLSARWPVTIASSQAGACRTRSSHPIEGKKRNARDWGEIGPLPTPHIKVALGERARVCAQPSRPPVGWLHPRRRGDEVHKGTGSDGVGLSGEENEGEEGLSRRAHRENASAADKILDQPKLGTAATIRSSAREIRIHAQSAAVTIRLATASSAPASASATTISLRSPTHPILVWRWPAPSSLEARNTRPSPYRILDSVAVRPSFSFDSQERGHPSLAVDTIYVALLLEMMDKTKEWEVLGDEKTIWAKKRRRGRGEGERDYPRTLMSQNRSIERGNADEG